MTEEKDADYYFEKLKDKGLNKDRYYLQTSLNISIIEAYKSKYLYLLAEVDNYKKSKEKELVEYIKYSNERLVDGDFLDLRAMNDIIFAVYSNPSSEENIKTHFQESILQVPRILQV